MLTMYAVVVSLFSLYLAVLAAILIVVGVAPFLFPTRYTFTDAGIEERGLVKRRHRRWRELRRYEIGPQAALVSPFSRPRWLDRYRGMVLFLDGADRAQVERILQARIQSSHG